MFSNSIWAIFKYNKLTKMRLEEQGGGKALVCKMEGTGLIPGWGDNVNILV